MDGTVGTVCHAIHLFYSGGAETQRAQEYLQAFQSSQESWTICDQIIGMHTDSLACYFAAQTLRTKINKNFEDLPSTTYEALRNSLLQHLNRHGASAYDEQSEATSTQLCLAIADLYIQVPTWNNWIFELLTQCQSLEGDRTVMTLTLLQVFPEEVEEIRGIGENRRNVIRQELADCETPMITFLSHVLVKYQNDPGMLKRVLRCLELNLQNKWMKTDAFAESPLILSIFEILSSSHFSSTLHEAATNVIVAALYRVEEIEKHEKLAQVLQTSIMQLVGPFKTAEQQEDYDRQQNLARIFVELCESFNVQIVMEANPDPSYVGSIACLELLLLVASNHDYSLMEMTFNVWYRITEHLFKYDDDDYIAKFRPFAQRFILAVYEHCKFDADDLNEVLDERSEFGEFRTKAVEAIRDVVFIVNTDECILTMYKKLEECARSHASWEDSEAAMFVMAAVVQNLLPESDGVMPQVISSIISLPQTSPPPLIVTSLALLGDCNDWFEQHTTLLERVLPWILQFAVDPRYSYYVAGCIDRISARCSVAMIGMLPNLMNLISALEHSTQNALKVEEAINGIIRACSLILSNIDAAEAGIGMEKLCEPIIQNLQKTIEMAANGLATNNNNASTNGGNKENEGENGVSGSGKKNDAWLAIGSRPILWVDRVGSVFKKTWKPNTPIRWIGIVEQFFGLLIRATRKFEGNGRFVEHSIRSMRLMFRSIGQQSLHFVEPIAQLMIDIYPRHHHSCFLYMSSVIVDQFGSIDLMRPGLLKLLETLSNVTFEVLNKPQGCLNHPDTVDDFFRLAQRFTSRATSAFFAHPISGALFDCAIGSLQLDHQEANQSVTRFLVEACNQLQKAKKMGYSDAGVEAVKELFATRGMQLVAAALNSALFHVSGHLKKDMAEVMNVVAKLDRNKFKEWLIAAVGALPNEPMKATPQQLNSFVENVVKEEETYHMYQHLKELIRLFS